MFDCFWFLHVKSKKKKLCLFARDIVEETNIDACSENMLGVACHRILDKIKHFWVLPFRQQFQFVSRPHIGKHREASPKENEIEMDFAHNLRKHLVWAEVEKWEEIYQRRWWISAHPKSRQSASIGIFKQHEGEACWYYWWCQRVTVGCEEF